MFDHKEYIASLPRRPGVYRMYGAEQELLYVGKARSLKDRVGTYFVPRNIDPKVQAQARADGVPDAWLEAAKRSPVWRMDMDWKIAGIDDFKPLRHGSFGLQQFNPAIDAIEFLLFLLN